MKIYAAISLAFFIGGASAPLSQATLNAQPTTEIGVRNRQNLRTDNSGNVLLNAVMTQPQLAKRKEKSDRKPAGVRGSCNVETPMTPLMPLSQGKFTGRTAEARPTFWFYVPYDSTAIRSGQFSLEDREGNLHYRLRFDAPAQAGLIRIQLPEGSEILSQPAQYFWHFTLYCVGEGSSPGERSPVFHKGSIERISDPNFTDRLVTASLESQIDLQAAKGLWYDVPANLAEIRSQPKAWKRFLEVLDLQDFEQLQIVPVVELVPLTD